eukprot:6175835-Pleurochrysis_carterae.AAC.6
MDSYSGRWPLARIVAARQEDFLYSWRMCCGLEGKRAMPASGARGKSNAIPSAKKPNALRAKTHSARTRSSRESRAHASSCCRHHSAAETAD